MSKLPLLNIGIEAAHIFLVQAIGGGGSGIYSLSLICPFILKTCIERLTSTRYHDKFMAYEDKQNVPVMTTMQFSKCQEKGM